MSYCFSQNPTFFLFSLQKKISHALWKRLFFVLGVYILQELRAESVSWPLNVQKMEPFGKLYNVFFQGASFQF